MLKAPCCDYPHYSYDPDVFDHIYDTDYSDDDYCIEDESFNCVPIRQKHKHLSQRISKKYKNKHRKGAYHPTIYRKGKKCNKKIM